MPATFEPHEARFAEEFISSSAADALAISTSIVPRERMRSVISAAINPSVAETRSWQFQKISKAGSVYPVTALTSSLASSTNPVPMLREGMELTLYPGEYLQATRDAATAGSTITLKVHFIESDLPFYQYKEPERKRMRLRRHGFPPDSLLGIRRGSINPHEAGGGGGGEPGPGEVGGGGGEPVL